MSLASRRPCIKDSVLAPSLPLMFKTKSQNSCETHKVRHYKGLVGPRPNAEWLAMNEILTHRSRQNEMTTFLERQAHIQLNSISEPVPYFCPRISVNFIRASAEEF
jgi:hypothetical protein